VFLFGTGLDRHSPTYATQISEITDGDHVNCLFSIARVVSICT
jgi:hypothetical protein